ncbi:MAG: hypothetical protein JNJ54_31000 [Myxococcaceae bacterium]|nr:hypothetical protein [Myxococcaceae bacterium]
MDDDDAFRLNSLNRFQKRSNLVLEAHSHCEVPAGCGGVVFQWRNPALGVTVRVHVRSSSRVAEAFIDGVPVSGLGVRLQPGGHLLALALVPAQEEPATAPWVMVHLERREPGAPTYPVQRLAGGETRDDGSWRATTTPPPTGWTERGFDDATWAPLRRSSTAGRDLEHWARRSFDEDRRLGSEPLAIPGVPAWLRKRFELPRQVSR